MCACRPVRLFLALASSCPIPRALSRLEIVLNYFACKQETPWFSAILHCFHSRSLLSVKIKVTLSHAPLVYF